MKVFVRALALTGIFLSPCMASNEPPAEGFCAQEGDIPVRPAGDLSGSVWAMRLGKVDDDGREALIRDALLAGEIPPFLRRLHPVELQGERDGKTTRIVLCVMPDYLSLGSDLDYLLVPMRLQTALDVADRYGFALPTPTVVDAIYAQSTVHLAPQPLPASPAMRSTRYYLGHDALSRAQRAELGAQAGMLVSGDKKDLVLTNRLWTNLERVAIYGWHRLDGHPIQPLSTVHGWHYVDYSHGVRLVSRRILVNGKPGDFLSALQDPSTARLLSSEGGISRIRSLIAQLAEPPLERLSAMAR